MQELMEEFEEMICEVVIVERFDENSEKNLNWNTMTKRLMKEMELGGNLNM